jgi:hypothetical protein
MIATVSTLLPPRDRRHVGIAATVLVHVVLILGWQITRRPPAVTPDPPRSTIQWIRLPAPAVPPPRREKEEQAPVPPRMMPRAGAITLPRVTVPDAPAVAPPAADTPASPSTPAPPEAPSAGATMLERARRDVGAIDRALRKENNPYIVAPPDSPQIRLRKGIAAAARLGPGEDELVNNTGDGARRTRVVAGGITYCVTERSPATSIDMIEKHGKTRITSCPEHESPASSQEWRTARD